MWLQLQLAGQPHGYSHADAQTGDSGDRAKATGNPVGERGRLRDPKVMFLPNWGIAK